MKDMFYEVIPESVLLAKLSYFERLGRTVGILIVIE